jgi:major vault protein
MGDDRGRAAKDLVLAPNEFAYISDETKGNVDVYVGPHKTSLANTDQPVLFDEEQKKFLPVALEAAKLTMVTAPVGWYVVLKNPCKDNKHPQPGTRQSNSDLEIGKKLNIPGPTSFALYPGQMAKVLSGHNIRSNQYLLVRVYDEEAARANWDTGVMKPSEPGATLEEKMTTSLTMGKLFVIKGTSVSFYIPPTGVEVVPDENGALVREAVTLESLDYCLLKDENGNKRYERGPAVVFPEPTEVFVEKQVADESGRTVTTRKFRAMELNENSGLYIKVIADYTDESGDHKVGDELFITGKDQMIYFPREEHAIVKYGDNEVHYAITIPLGEARYVLNRNTGDIRLAKGSDMLLPDPRKEVIVKRILDAKMIQLLYPGNQGALEHNAKLMGVDLDTYLGMNNSAVEEVAVAAMFDHAPLERVRSYNMATTTVPDNLRGRKIGTPAAKGFAGDGFSRKNQYTEPRTVTLNTKFDGAVGIDVWTGYAIKLVRKSGESRIIIGPSTVIAEYDELPQVLNLSTGKPKTTDSLYKTVFLQVTANKVSDIVDVETKDFCKLTLRLSYKVNFEGDKNKWFEVDNYVKFLCDHMRSKIRNAVSRYGIEEFYGNAANILRDVILGQHQEGKARTGTVFTENGMKIYDVEVLKVELENQEVQKMLVKAQRDVIDQTLQLAAARRQLEFTRENELLQQETAKAKFETTEKALLLAQEETNLRLVHDLALIEANSQKVEQNLHCELEAQSARNVIESKKLEARREAATLENTITQEVQDIKLRMLKAEVESVVEKAKAVSPDLVAALTAFGEKALIEKVSESMAPLAILGGTSVQDVLCKLLQGTSLAKHLIPAVNGSSVSGPVVTARA